MIVIIALSMVLYIAYAIKVIYFFSDRFNDDVLGLLLSLFAIIMPAAIIIQILFSLGYIHE